MFLPIYAAEASVFLTQAQGKLDGIKVFGCDGLDGLQTKVSDMAMLEGVMMLTPLPWTLPTPRPRPSWTSSPSSTAPLLISSPPTPTTPCMP